jgi:N-acetylmuramoyl-L-alanine amidase
MRIPAVLLVSVLVATAQSDRSPLKSVTAVRHWTRSDSTRVAIEISGEFTFRTDRLHDPERVYFDIPDAHPRFESRRGYLETLDDRFVKRIRVAETRPGVTRIVLDVAPESEAIPSILSNPSRLMIELRVAAPPLVTSSTVPALPAPPPVKEPSPKAEVPVALKQPVKPPVRAEIARSDAPRNDAPRGEGSELQIPRTVTASPEPVKTAPEPIKTAMESPRPAAITATTSSVTSSPATTATTATERSSTEFGKAARHNSSGETSLVRALGLKINRVVIDPGHGGHDQGTEGGKGLLEKDLVLDVARRVGKLIEDRMGAEVIYTRTDDTFIPLEGRTALANEKHADLFLSIHANSSPYPRISGVETYYLNFSGEKDSLDVAARENASSQKTVFELRDLIQKITLHDKAEESREFAGRVQTSLYALSAKSSAAAKNRGVKKAPFVVLIGASMPSVLAEIGFLSNPREESLLKKPEYREKVAEALFRGISRYSEGLSHFQVAQAQQ